jgi:hypothetical protein
LTENGAMKRHFSTGASKVAAAPPRNGGSKDEIGQQKFAAMAGPDAELSSDATDDAHLDAQVGVDSAAARGAYAGNTERALRADVTIFTAWCSDAGEIALPAVAATVAAFIDAIAALKAPATVRRYVSSIATLGSLTQGT